MNISDNNNWTFPLNFVSRLDDNLFKSIFVIFNKDNFLSSICFKFLSFKKSDKTSKICSIPSNGIVSITSSKIVNDDEKGIYSLLHNHKIKFVKKSPNSIWFKLFDKYLFKFNWYWIRISFTNWFIWFSLFSLFLLSMILFNFWEIWFFASSIFGFLKISDINSLNWVLII